MSNEPQYQNIGEFYAARQARERSPEADYGVFWTEPGSKARWRVSYIKDTGEIYALNQNSGQIRVMGCVPSDPVAEGDYKAIWYNDLETILDGWATVCAKPGSMMWLRQRLSAYPVPPQS